jgi:PiT family inorganic phosphate transporter
MKLLQIYFTKNTHSEKRQIFRHLQIGSACFVALSHGLNDAQKSMGLITLGLFTAGVLTTPTIPLWVILSCAIVMGLGTASGGLRIIKTMGFAITKIDPMQGFAAETSASAIILAASFLGMPVSSTQMIAGSITGVGSAKGIAAVRWETPQKLVVAWVLTLPAAGIVGYITCFTISTIFGAQ